jgi:hypothetical protein
MKKVLAIIAILIILFITGIWFYYFRGGKNTIAGPKAVPIAVSKHSKAFNISISELLYSYYKMADGFVKSDTIVIDKYATGLLTTFDAVKTEELKKDTTKDADKIYLTAIDFISNSKNEINNILQQPVLDKKREALNSLTDDLRSLLITIKYDQNRIYYQECLTAFPNEIPGYWLSPTADIHNPYPGKDECGSVKDSIDFIARDTTKRSL